MEELIEKYINANAGGVKIAEMEETLQQSRLRLAYVTRKLFILFIAVAGFSVSSYAQVSATATSLTHTNTIDTMTADTWTSSPTPTGTLSAGGAQTLTVGATLYVGASQLAGVYTSGAPFTVTVNNN